MIVTLVLLMVRISIRIYWLMSDDEEHGKKSRDRKRERMYLKNFDSHKSSRKEHFNHRRPH